MTHLKSAPEHLLVEERELTDGADTFRRPPVAPKHPPVEERRVPDGADAHRRPRVVLEHPPVVDDRIDNHVSNLTALSSPRPQNKRLPPLPSAPTNMSSGNGNGGQVANTGAPAQEPDHLETRNLFGMLPSPENRYIY